MFVEHEWFFIEPLNILIITNMASIFDTKNTIKIPFGACVWIFCSAISWGSFVFKYNIGFVGVITWIVSILGIIMFILTHLSRIQI